MQPDYDKRAFRMATSMKQAVQTRWWTISLVCVVFAQFSPQLEAQAESAESSSLYRIRSLPAASSSLPPSAISARVPHAPEEYLPDNSASPLASVVFDLERARQIEDETQVDYVATINVYEQREPIAAKAKPLEQRFSGALTAKALSGSSRRDYGANAKPCPAFPSQSTSGLGTQFNF